jgi:hypothetical protein
MTAWRKSSYSCDTANCVEVACDVWRTSTRSLGNGNCVEVGWRTSTRSPVDENCVEVGGCCCDGVLVRDSKDRDGPRLSFAASTWTDFLAGCKTGEFDL